MEPLDPRIQACIEACNRCHGSCLAMAFNHCLDQGGDHVAPPHFRLMADCAQICATAADFMLRSSVHHAAICAACADVCDACADSCEGLDGMEDCVAACRACAESCRAMALPH
ncbi:four-helix bundle copper-binding protein [Glacieibacterium frigidum]|uniref:Four-helix bundle copper-binding protein n=1 Tax=Glacieibacterium frigidum TaxID=2593303 RepID=A0A552UA85_9SPHN|nr:four-helix bundle copper-binding protein [Glacieibacterium frigidum]TRW15109.1 four-helix bundle copper-binding protein [Glacieibacterium frigidum]